MPKTLNVGMIGYKFMGRAHSNAWLKADKFFDLKARPVLKVICGRDKGGGDERLHRWGWNQFVTDWREVVDDPTIDIIDINTPNDTHAEIAIAAAKAGQGDPVREAAGARREAGRADGGRGEEGRRRQHGLPQLPAHPRDRPGEEDDRRRASSGTIYHYRARYAQDWIVDPEFSARLAVAEQDCRVSGTHGDINAHIIDLGRYLVGEFSEVCGQMETFIKERPLPGEASKKGKVTVDDAVMFIGRIPERGAGESGSHARSRSAARMASRSRSTAAKARWFSISRT